MSSAYHGNVCSSAFTQHHTTATLSANENTHTQHPRPTIDSFSQVPLRLDRIIHSPLLSRHRVRRNSTFLSPELCRCQSTPIPVAGTIFYSSVCHSSRYRLLISQTSAVSGARRVPGTKNPPCSFLGQLTDASDRYLTRDRFAMCHNAGHPHFTLYASNSQHVSLIHPHAGVLGSFIRSELRIY